MLLALLELPFALRDQPRSIWLLRRGWRTETPPRGGGGAVCELPFARFPQDDVGGAVFSRLLEPDEAAAHPLRSEFRAAQLQADVGLAARLGDLAPAGAELIVMRFTA